MDYVIDLVSHLGEARIQGTNEGGMRNGKHEAQMRTNGKPRGTHEGGMRNGKREAQMRTNGKCEARMRAEWEMGNTKHK